MTDLVPLLIGAALVGVLHMSAPDHWVTLCVLSRASGWNSRKLFNISLVTAVGHSVLSAALGFGIAIVGLLFSRLISSYISYAVGFVMLAAGLFVGVRARARYHNRLFTDFKGRQSALEEFCGDFVIEGNTIKKAYLSHTPIKSMSQGDILLFYRSHDIHAITSLGVLEEFFWSNDAQKIYDKVKSRTVYPLRELQEIAKKPTLILLFRFHFHFPVININKLKALNVLSSAPPTMREIDHTAYLKIKKESLLDERYTVN